MPGSPLPGAARPEERPTERIVPTKKKLKVKRVHVPYIGSVSTVQGRFTATVDVDVTWWTTEEDRRKWAKDDHAEYRPQFKPTIFVMNGINVVMENIEYSHGSQYGIFGDHMKNYMRCRFSGEFSETFDLSNFPFDVQDLAITFAIDFWRADQMYFEICNCQDYIMSVPTRYAGLEPEWTPLRAHCFTVCDTKTEEGKETQNQKFNAPWATGEDIDRSRLICKVQIKRNCASYLVRIGVPCLGLNGLLFSVFSCKDGHDRVAVALTIMLTYVALLYTLTNMIPMAGHVSIADLYVLLSMCLSILGLAISVSAAAFDEADSGLLLSLKVCESADCLAGPLLVALEVIMHAYLIRCMRRAIREENHKLKKSRTDFIADCTATARKMGSLWTTWPIRNDDDEVTRAEKGAICFSRLGLRAVYEVPPGWPPLLQDEEDVQGEGASADSEEEGTKPEADRLCI